MSQAEIIWPVSDEHYADEFGEIDASVYAAAQKIWPGCRRYARDLLSDEATGQGLLFQAAAQVTRKLRESNQNFGNLTGYLRQSFNRLVHAELRYLQREHGADDEFAQLPTAPAVDLDTLIYLDEILEQMDAPTRAIVQPLLLGHTYEGRVGKLSDQRGRTHWLSRSLVRWRG